MKEMDNEKTTRFNIASHPLVARLLAGAREDLPAVDLKNRSADRG